MQDRVLMEMPVSLEAVIALKAGWRSALVETGELSVMTPGMFWMPWLFADNSSMQLKVMVCGDSD